MNHKLPSGASQVGKPGTELSPASAGLFHGVRTETRTLCKWYYSPMWVTVCFGGAVIPNALTAAKSSLRCATDLCYGLGGFAVTRIRQAQWDRDLAPLRWGFFRAASENRHRNQCVGTSFERWACRSQRSWSLATRSAGDPTGKLTSKPTCLLPG